MRGEDNRQQKNKNIAQSTNISSDTNASTNISSENKRFIIKRLKNEFSPFIKEMSLLFSIVTVLGIIYFYTRGYMINLQNSKQVAETQLKQVDEIIVESKNSLIVWEQVKEKLKNRKGLDIEAFRALVEVIQLKHAISDLEIILTTPTTRNDSKDKQFVNLEHNEIEMNFNSITDVEAYRFLIELMNNIPGILHIEKFEFDAKTDLENAIVQTLREGEIQSMVEISLTFKWHNIIDL